LLGPHMFLRMTCIPVLVTYLLLISGSRRRASLQCILLFARTWGSQSRSGNGSSHRWSPLNLHSLPPGFSFIPSQQTRDRFSDAPPQLPHRYIPAAAISMLPRMVGRIYYRYRSALFYYRRTLLPHAAHTRTVTARTRLHAPHLHRAPTHRHTH